eukprot:Nitzschia sp. Nitz4//scaffold164_size50480//22571//24115//NITZ4_007004-RA/size50480-processed-gene-0.77-mRNA-1//-1//CDS//3329538080//5367//frame0
MAAKRPLKSTEPPSWWKTLTDKIESQGGFIHPHLKFDADARILGVQETVENEGTIVLKLPYSTLVSETWADDQLPPSWREKCNDSEIAWNSPISDLLLAWALAMALPETCPYLHTLPPSESFDCLPRRWSDEELEINLKGSSLLDRVKQNKLGVVKDYQMMQTMWQGNGHCPSFESYSDMLAAVSSRAFDIPNSSKISSNTSSIALVPILDLCDHCRGPKDKKNLMYSFENCDDDDQEVGNMVVRLAVSKIAPGESLRLTYGAQGNAQLLLNYGFCIPDNVEPDGSSNDVVSFSPPVARSGGEVQEEKDTPVSFPLRIGPKAYTYPCLVQALRHFREESKLSTPSQDGEEESDDANDDMEAFLNDCEEPDGDGDEDEDDGDFDAMYMGQEPDGLGHGGLAADGDSAPMLSRSERVQREKVALKKLKDALDHCLQGYPSVESSSLSTTTTGRYAAILIASEQQTLNFYIMAIDKILKLLEHPPEEENPQIDTAVVVEQQTDELANAFYRILIQES